MKKIFLFIALIFILSHAADFEYKVHDTLFPKGLGKIDITNTINVRNEYKNNLIICQGDTKNIENYIQRNVQYTNLDIETYCHFDQYGPEKNCWEVNTGGPGGGGYTPQTNLIRTGTSNLISNADRNYIITKSEDRAYNFPHSTDTNLNTLIENVLGNEKFALLTRWEGGLKINARGRVGVACTGTYTYLINRPDGPAISRAGDLLNDIKAEYTFNAIGDYRIDYSTTVNKCLLVYEERYRNSQGNTINTIHVFGEPGKETSKTRTDTLNLKVVSDEDPDFSRGSENAHCSIISSGWFSFPPYLIKDTKVTIPVRMTIQNPYDVPIFVRGVSSRYNYESISNVFGNEIILYLPTEDVTSTVKETEPCISSSPSLTCGYVEIGAGEQMDVNVYVESELIADNPLDEYYLQISFNYYYNAPSHGCYGEGSGTGSCMNNIRIYSFDDDEEELPEPEITYGYTLNSNVNINPNLINFAFVEQGGKTVDISGRVNLTTIEITTIPTTPPIVTTEEIGTSWLGGATVELLSLKTETGIDCMKTKPTDVITNNLPPRMKGFYQFNNVELTDSCLEYNLNEELIAEIKVTHEDKSGEFKGTGKILTTIPQLRCEITYKMTDSFYFAEKGTESYEISVHIYNSRKLRDIKYTCMAGEPGEEIHEFGNEKEDLFEFDCEYEFEFGHEDEVYMVRAEIFDEIGERTYVCTTEVGLCLPFV